MKKWKSVIISISFHDLTAGFCEGFLKNQLERSSSLYSSPRKNWKSVLPTRIMSSIYTCVLPSVRLPLTKVP